jgi:hypothetical protein
LARAAEGGAVSEVDAPLLKESKAFVRRLETALARFNESRHRTARRLNWSYRYASGFYVKEAELFASDPDRYLDGGLEPVSTVEDVFPVTVGLKKILETLLKVCVHWIFHLVGLVTGPFFPHRQARIFRKCYVDDVENVFDPDERDVVRFIFPFPLGMRRQLKYIAFLVRGGYRFRIAGYPYGIVDLLRFLRRRDVGSLERLEARAQVRLGLTIRRQPNWEKIQLSDEFDICSLDFVGALRRPGLKVINSAHGVGKYFPVHAYDEFHVLMQKQIDYYKGLWPCRYMITSLLSSQKTDMNAPVQPAAASGDIQFVFVSQTSASAGDYLDRCETEVLGALAERFGATAGIDLYIKSHPNRAKPLDLAGFKNLGSLSDLRSPDRTIFVSFYSTSHIDPAFKGTRLLLSYGLIRPGIAFDDDGSIVDLDRLVRILESRLEVNANPKGETVDDGREHPQRKTPR